MPFTLTTVSAIDGRGHATLDGEREFRFSEGSQFVDDRLIATGRQGELRSLFGASGRVELLLDATATADGALRMVSRRVSVRLGRLRLPLPRLLAVRVVVEDGWDDSAARRTIDVRAVSPIAGVVLEYRGWYRLVAEASAQYE